jgi:hypothetical protein
MELRRHNIRGGEIRLWIGNTNKKALDIKCFTTAFLCITVPSSKMMK